MPNLTLDDNRNPIQLSLLIAGEDLTVGVMKVEQRFSAGAVIVADALIKSGAGFLHSINITPNDAAALAGSIILYDNTAESGTVLENVSIVAAYFVPVSLICDKSFATGLYAGFTTTADVNLSLSYR